MQPKKKRIPKDVVPGVILIAAAALGILMANSPLASGYQTVLNLPVSVALGSLELEKPLLLCINDGLMAIFFLVVALELKREVLEGELSNRSQVALPLGAAIGGILVPAALYTAINFQDSEALRGWAIPAATDIAFALGVLAMLGDRVPRSLKMFLLSLAVFDDIGAILIIAAFYTAEISWTAHGLALIATAVLFGMNRAKVTRTSPYLAVGAALWLFVLKSGVHATLAGVIVGLMIPHRRQNAFGRSSVKDLEHSVHPWVIYFIIPVFAIANSGVSLQGVSQAILDPVALGIIAGLFFGKMIGVYGASALMVRAGWAKLPAGANWSALLGVSILSGIGFTMSLFIGTLAFEHSARDFSVPVRLGVLAGSLVSATVGFLLLRRALPAAAPEPAAEPSPAKLAQDPNLRGI